MKHIALFTPFDWINSLRHLVQEYRSISLESISPLRSLAVLVFAQVVGGPIFFLTSSPDAARKATQQIECLRSITGIEGKILFTDIQGEQEDLIFQRRLREEEPLVVILPAEALNRDIVELSSFERNSFLLQPGDELDRESLLEKLAEMGYQHTDFVWEKGDMAVRGEVLDFFPPHYDLPVRTFWWGNTLEKVKLFQPETQRTSVALERCMVFPRDGDFRRVPLVSLLKRKAQALFWDGALVESPLLEEKLHIMSGITARPEIPRLKVPGERAPVFRGNTGELVAFLKGSFYTRVIVALPPEKSSLMCELFKDENIPFSRSPASSGVVVLDAYPVEGFAVPEIGMVFLTGREIFGAEMTRPRKKRIPHPPREAPSQLEPGEYVVHDEHGIGLYRGQREMTLQGVRRAFLTVEYAFGDMLHVPAESAHLLQKYQGAGEVKPRLSRLGRDEWARAKARVKRSVEEVAKELLEIYARRHVGEGHAFSPDESWARKLELSFPYIETPDQRQAIEDVKRDMELSRPMDRLVCGDVGYGKTEVALRAAFKAVMDGKQVAVLAPTTILSEQHYVTFKERLRGFPLTTAVLNRFKGPAEQRRILEEVREGKIDIIIGTHRLLSRDIVFRDLGLLVVDEEQRFGVRHKERLKKMKSTVDVLTLSATPIPRTLYLSLTGTRDISVIETPPEGRRPVHTMVLLHRAETIREAIEFELARGGQVFYVCPRIRNLFKAREELLSIVPGVNLAIAHGQLSGPELEGVMENFYRGDIKVLLCTTIIEIGLDIPNANTLIVDPATMFGLAQLYQLRGRIGRFDREAFAYFLHSRRMTDESRERLEAIMEFSELGSGLKLAMRDLEIRGAGNILGAEQHGQIQEVGFSLYTRMLEQEIARLKGEDTPSPAAVGVSLREDAYIPGSYMENEGERFRYYQRLLHITEVEEIDRLRDEWEDRLGKVPPEMENLLKIAKLRWYGKICQVESLEERSERIFIIAPLNVLVTLSERFASKSIKGTLSQLGGRVALKLPLMGIELLLRIFQEAAWNHMQGVTG